jgi:tetratricopeptide (TPR) repeat protein
VQAVKIEGKPMAKRPNHLMNAKIAEGKIARVERAIRDSFPTGVLGIFVIGSITGEGTAASDLDVLVVFADEGFNKELEAIRPTFDRIAASINAEAPQHEVTIWAAKSDHFLAFFPDISYVRANSPTASTRLDGWCGLAKLTLRAYVAASGRRLFGEFSFDHAPEGVLPYEPLELFLIATRTLAKGLAARADDPLAERNDLAKAGLRAAYAALTRLDGKVRLRYADILAGACDAPFGEHLRLVKDLFAIKTGNSTGEVRIVDLLALFRFCENIIADVPRPRIEGVAHGRAGESFAFAAENLLATSRVPLEDYARCPSPRENYIHYFYFVRTASRIVELLSRADIEDEALDFFFPEISVMATQALYNPGGVRLIIGRAEPEELHLPLGLAFLEIVSPLTERLARLYDAPTSSRMDSLWLPRPTKLARLRGLLDFISAGPKLEIAPDLLVALEHSVPERDYFAALAWQAELVSGQLNLDAADAFGRIGLTLYQAGQLTAAKHVLEPLIEEPHRFADLLPGVSAIGNEALRSLKSKFSSVSHYHALVLHREADFAGATVSYRRSLELDPQNVSALSDYSRMLMETRPDDQTAEELSELVASADSLSGARREIADRFQGQAISLKKRGDFAAARIWYERAIAIDPGYAKPVYNLGLLHEAAGEPDLAEGLYRQAIAFDPQYARPRHQLGYVLEARGDIDSAIAAYEEAVALGLADAGIFANLGKCRLRKGDAEGAVAAYNLALARDPGDANALGGLGEVCFHTGVRTLDPQALALALQYFTQAFAADPTHEQALRRRDQTRQIIDAILAGSTDIAALLDANCAGRA